MNRLYITEIEQPKLRRRLKKAASELRLHYFLRRINATVVVKWFKFRPTILAMGRSVYIIRASYMDI